MDSYNFETKSISETLLVLSSDKKNGLKEQEVNDRLLKHGENKLQEKKKKPWFLVFLSQLNNPMIYVLFAAIAVTIGVSIYDTIKVVNSGQPFDFLSVGDWPDVIIILIVILMNGIIGTVQEIKAESSLEALKKLSSPETTVLRDGKKLKVKSSTLVPGDIVYLEEGDTIGADLRLIETHNLKTNESSLTGESTQVEKSAETVFSNKVGIGDRINCAYMSTTVTYGRGVGVVIATGMNTEIGKIATSLDNEKEEMTPLQKTLEKLSKTLGLIALAVIVFVLLADIIWIFIDGKGGEVEAYIEAILSAISLAVAAIPEGLPAVVTIVLSIGVQRMVKANTIVRKLHSVETLGAVSVVCSDKTGTLTQNKMTVVEAYVNDSIILRKDFDGTNNELKTLAKGMTLCSNAGVEDGVYGDPTEIALVNFGLELDLHKSILEQEMPRIDEYPFDSVRKMMTTKHTINGEIINYTKGALDSILSRTKKIYQNGVERDILEEDIKRIYEINNNFSLRALRVLALAYNDEKDKMSEENLVFVGLVAMVDPAREEAKPAVKTFKDAGIITVMITGDHKDTAFAIAKELGICENMNQCMFGYEVDALSEEELREKCKTVRVFARVSPENKVQIVKAFQANGNICAMTGDGVNDAPSLKASNIGIAMGITGTDVAKSAADMVLTDDNFASIEKAVEEGKAIYTDIKKTVLFLLSSNIAEILSMFIIICIGLPAPLIAIHLLWVNLITDSLPAVALGMDPKEKDIMKEKPRNPNESIFARGGYGIVGGYGFVITIAVLLAYFSAGWINGAYSLSAIKHLFETNPNVLSEAQTMAFTTLAFCELFHMLGVSNVKETVFKIYKKKNVVILIAFLVGILLQLAVIEIPFVRDVFSTEDLSWLEWGVTALLSLLPLIVHEVIVLVRFILSKRKAK